MKFNDQKKLYRQNALTQSDILYLPDSRGLDVTVVSGKCADIIRSIHGSLSRLAPMGDDERRSLWFEVKGKRWEWYRLAYSIRRGQAEIPGHLLKQRESSVKISGIELDEPEDEEIAVAYSAWKRRVRLTPSGMRDLTPRAK